MELKSNSKKHLDFQVFINHFYFYSFLSFFRLPFVTVVKNRKVKKRASFLNIKVMTAPTRDTIIINLNQSCPPLFSSFVRFERIIPMGKPKIRTNIPIKIV